MKTTYKYKAFISYKHSEIGIKHAVALEAGLKRYANPLLSRPMKIFRDEKHMVPGNDLGKLITNGLEQSEYLIFIAEKGAASSTWCQDELEYWCGALGRKDKMIIVHTDDSIHLDIENKKVDWKNTNALPSLLGNYISSIPFYVDLHWAKKKEELSLEHFQYKSIINLISAKLRGVAPEELNDEELRVYRRNKRLRNVFIGVFIIAVLSGGFALSNWYQKSELETKQVQLEKAYSELETSNTELNKTLKQLNDARDSILQKEKELQELRKTELDNSIKRLFLDDKRDRDEAQSKLLTEYGKDSTLIPKLMDYCLEELSEKKIRQSNVFLLTYKVTGILNQLAPKALYKNRDSIDLYFRKVDAVRQGYKELIDKFPTSKLILNAIKNDFPEIRRKINRN